MAVIERNRQIAEDIFELTLTGVALGKAGQFVQLWLPDAAGMLPPRPISIFNIDEAAGKTLLVYRVVGRGTKLLSGLKDGELRVSGPFGNGFPIEPGEATLIGGGLGIAPLYLLCRTLRETEPTRRIHVALGYSRTTFLEKAFDPLCDSTVLSISGVITKHVDFHNPGTYYACGPAPMMEALAKMAAAHGRKLYVSLEKRMACGVGACYACSVATRSGNRRVCRDGPVFPADEVYYET